MRTNARSKLREIENSNSSSSSSNNNTNNIQQIKIRKIILNQYKYPDHNQNEEISNWWSGLTSDTRMTITVKYYKNK